MAPSSPPLPQNPIYISRTASTYTFSPSSSPQIPASTPPHLIRALHNSLPSFSPTPLIHLPLTDPHQTSTPPSTSTSTSTPPLPLRNLHLKSETSRLNLPAFKILGASWATYITLCNLFNLPADPGVTSLEVLAQRARDRRVVLFAGTDGNFGRAMGRMSAILSQAGVVAGGDGGGEVGEVGGGGEGGGTAGEGGKGGVQARVYVPYFTDEATVAKIESEGVNGSVRVVRVDGDYDEAVLATAKACSVFNNANGSHGDGKGGGLGVHIQDNAFDDYTTIPHHITDGYTTMLHEITAQLSELGKTPDFIVTPVGVGSLAHAVVKFAKSAYNAKPIKVITVEAEAAPCLNMNLREGRHFAVQTGRTVMDGLCCGTVSPTAWPVLKEGVDVSVTIGERECHQGVLELREVGLDAGPCGAAVLAGLKRVWADEALRKEIGLHEDSVVVGIVTEGRRDYVVPK